jgi:hypothetical protein
MKYVQPTIATIPAIRLAPLWIKGRSGFEKSLLFDVMLRLQKG